MKLKLFVETCKAVAIVNILCAYNCSMPAHETMPYKYWEVWLIPVFTQSNAPLILTRIQFLWPPLPKKGKYFQRGKTCPFMCCCYWTGLYHCQTTTTHLLFSYSTTNFTSLKCLYYYDRWNFKASFDHPLSLIFPWRMHLPAYCWLWTRGIRSSALAMCPHVVPYNLIDAQVQRL